ncbi:hypothetical protein [Dulcicalothrix desertica]|nr:hypothetical protein [Dulcicalothrix desertica]
MKEMNEAIRHVASRTSKYIIYPTCTKFHQDWRRQRVKIINQPLTQEYDL